MSTLFFDAFTRFGPRPYVHGAQPWAFEQLLEEMAHCSISGALVASTACVQYDPMLENRRLSARLAPHAHLFPLWNVMPHWTGEFPEPAALTGMLEEAGVRAVTMYPRANGWPILSEFSRPLLEEMQRTRTLVIFDGRSEMNEATLETLTERYPELPVLLVGVSWGRQRALLPLLLHRKNVHIAFDHLQANRVIEWLVGHGCEDQLIFASNAVEMSMGAHRCFIDYAEVPAAVKDKIASGNLIRLLKGQAPPRAVVNPQEDALMAEARQGKPLSVPVHDFHTHILDEGLQGAGGGYPMFDGGPSGVGRLAARMGVAAIGLMSWDGTVGAHADQGNACTTAALDALPNCWGLATFDVARQAPEVIREKLDAIFADERFLGLKPYPAYGKPYDDPAYDVLWEFGNARGLYALLHPNRSDLSEFDNLCPRFPNLTFVAAHCGGSYDVAERAVTRAKKYPNFYMEITLTPVCMNIIDYLAAGAGADRVLYGSDQPMRDPRPQLGWVVYSRLPVEDKRKILSENAQRLLARIREASSLRMGHLS